MNKKLLSLIYMKNKLFNVFFILMMMFLMSSCSNEEKEEWMNIDTIIDNGNCQLRKTNYSGSDDDIIDLILDEDLVTIKYGTFPGTYLREYEENYYFYNSKIYYRKLFYEAEYRDNGTLRNYDTYYTSFEVNTDNLGVGNSFYKFKKLIQLLYIFMTDMNTILDIDGIYNDIINDTKITSSFDSNLGFYDNIKNYYNNILPEFNENNKYYLLDNEGIYISNNKFVKYTNSNKNHTIINMEIPNYDKYDYQALTESNCMKYMSNLKQTYDNVNYAQAYDVTSLLIDNSSLAKEKVRKIQASKYRYDLNLNEVLHIIEYTTNKKAKDMFDKLMSNYAPNSAYFGYKDNMLFISNLENNKASYKDIIDVELKSSNTYQNTNNILVENVLSFGLDDKYMENNFSGMIISSYDEYNNLVEMAKANITESIIYDINTMFNVISKDDFTNFKFVLIQMQIMPYKDGWKYKYTFNSSELKNGVLDIAYDEQEIPAEYAVAENACSYTLYKINKDIKIDKINITSYKSIGILGRYFSMNDEMYEIEFGNK